MKKLSFESLVGILMLLFAIGFNLWLYKLEPTAKVDPNDNTFQYALVDRTNQIWEYANKTCSGFFVSRISCHVSLLTDHWVPNWAEGYNLPYYYSHIPQIAIVGSYRLVGWMTHLSLFQYYHWVIYLLLSFFPLSVFVALRIVGLSWLTTGIGALLASHLSTDGLYGLDPASFLWRGYGLSSQLFAMIWLPLAIAAAWKYFNGDKKNPILAIVTLVATTAGHLGVGIMAFLSVGILAISPTIQAVLTQQWNRQTVPHLGNRLGKLLLLFAGAGLLLGYWILPILLHGNYHNISFWDPVWKFDSYGAKEIIVRLFNGDLFDFGRLPILTALVFVGVLSAMGAKYFSFSVLFVFWFLMYFGRTTWGFIDLIPGMKEFHLSRFIVGLQVTGLFLIPMGVEWLASFITHYTRKLKLSFIHICVYSLISLFLCLLVYPQTIRYSRHNDVLIGQANENFDRIKDDVALLLTTLRDYQATAPGRVFAGRGGSWGRDFRVAETPYYMYLSTYGIPTVLWLPQTWSPNSDTEQYFSEDQAKDYTLYNIRYVVTPPSQTPQTFWKLLKETASWKLYEVATDGYVTTGAIPAIVSTDKESFINVVRLWIQSDYNKQGLYPLLTFDTDYPKNEGLPNFRMMDEAMYKIPDGTIHSLFAEIPRYVSPREDTTLPTVISQSNNTDMVFTATVEVKEGCSECVVILRQTFHPSWRATIDGKPTQTITVFPFYTAVKLETPGIHEIVFFYRQSALKGGLLLLTIISLAVLFWKTRLKSSKISN